MEMETHLERRASLPEAARALVEVDVALADDLVVAIDTLVEREIRTLVATEETGSVRLARIGRLSLFRHELEGAVNDELDTGR